MKLIQNFLRSCISYIFIAVIIWIITSVLLFDGSSISINSKAPIAMSIIALISLGIIVHLGANALKKNNTEKTWVIFGTITGSIIILVAVFLRTKLDTSWDPGAIYKTVYNKITGVSGDWLEYFRSFPFQFFILCFYYTICKIVLAILPFLSVGVVMYATNCALVVISVLLFVMTLCRLLGNIYISKFISYFFIFATSILLYSAVIYTDTASMAAIAGMLYLTSYIYTKKKENMWAYPVLGFLALLGFLLKASAVIYLFAFIIVLWLSDKAFKSKMISTLLILTMFIAGELIWTPFLSKYTKSDKEIPKSHWVMMGLSGYGGFNKEDYALTEKVLQDNKDANKECIKEIINRLENYSPLGYLNFLSKKISYTWGDGTYLISEKLARSPRNANSIISDIFRGGGKYNKTYEWIADTLHLTMLFSLLIGAFATRKDRSSIILIYKLTVIGVFIFFLLWETRSRYLLNYTPVIYALSGNFIYTMAYYIYQKRLRMSYILLTCHCSGIEKTSIRK